MTKTKTTIYLCQPGVYEGITHLEKNSLFLGVSGKGFWNNIKTVVKIMRAIWEVGETK